MTLVYVTEGEGGEVGNVYESYEAVLKDHPGYAKYRESYDGGHLREARLHNRDTDHCVAVRVHGIITMDHVVKSRGLIRVAGSGFGG